MIFMNQENYIKSNIEPTVERYLVAYVDILGYKDYLEKHPLSENDFLRKIKATVDKFKKCIEAELDLGQKIEIKIFSDNFLICKKLEPLDSEYMESIETMELISELAHFQLMILGEYNLLTRGAITIGTLYIDSDFVFGSALIELHKLETSAKYPRIVISENDIIKIEKLISNHPDPCIDLDYIFPKDIDGKRYLNYCTTSYTKPDCNSDSGPSSECCELMSYLYLMRSSLLKTIDNFNEDTSRDNTSNNNKNIEKYEWIIKKHNDACLSVYRNDWQIKYKISQSGDKKYIIIDNSI
jgi:hypothetical protein